MKNLTPAEVQVREILRNISHESVERIDNILQALQTYAFLQYAEGEEIIIPYFGKFLLKYKGDEITPEGREAIVETFFVPSESLKENIGECEDYKKNPKKGITSISIFKKFQAMNERQLRKELNEEISKDVTSYGE